MHFNLQFKDSNGGLRQLGQEAAMVQGGHFPTGLYVERWNVTLDLHQGGMQSSSGQDSFAHNHGLETLHFCIDQITEDGHHNFYLNEL